MLINIYFLGHISLPSLGVTTLNRVLNPLLRSSAGALRSSLIFFLAPFLLAGRRKKIRERIVFTSHINNLSMYAFIQSELSNIGRFQTSGNNVIRYIIGDIKGIMILINLMHGKLRTPKNKRFNSLIEFMNAKYSLDTPESLLDNSNLVNNS